MDAYQQSHGYIRPPHTAADPQQHHFHNGQPPPRPPGPPTHDAWFSNQFQYHPSQTPSPPPRQWAPPPPPPQDHFSSSGSCHQPSNPYPPHYSFNQNQFPTPSPPLPRPHMPSQYPPHSHIPQSYPQVNQNWCTPNCGGQQTWDYSAHKGEEDWAARARAWADARAAMDSQHPQSQFTPSGRSQDHAHYHDQYAQSADLHYPDTQNQSLNAYHQFSASAAPAHNAAVTSLDTAFMGSDSSSYVPDAHGSHKVRDGIMARETSTILQHQGDPPTSQPVHLPEVPSSYSSVAGKEEVVNKSEQSYASLSNLSAPDGQYLVQPPMHSHYMNAHQLMEPVNPADQPLEFTHKYIHDNDPQMQLSYAHHDPVGPIGGINPVSPVPPIKNWSSSAVPGAAYSSISPVLSSRPLHDPSVNIASSVPGHLAPPFGTFTVPGFPPPISSLNGGTAISRTSGLPVDEYGISGLFERNRKASVPNWLRDEIKKAVVSGPSTDHPKVETQYMDDETVDKSYGKGDQADSKSADSSRSTEEEEDEEDYVEAARTAAINQEIKRVLTEVLLKVTDELFDEIAAKVINEDEMAVDAYKGIATSNHKVPPSQGSVATPKASAKVLISSKVKETQAGEIGKADSSAPGNLLGLASYASDDDDDVIQSPILPNYAKNSAFQQPSNNKPSGNVNDTTKLGTSDMEDYGTGQVSQLTDGGKTNLLLSENEKGPSVGQWHDVINRESDHGQPLEMFPAEKDAGDDSGGGVYGRSNSKDSRNKPKSELPENISELERKITAPQGLVTQTRSDKADQNEKISFRQAKDYKRDKITSKKESMGCVKEEMRVKMKADEKGIGYQKRHDEKHSSKENADGSSAKEKPKEHNAKHREKGKESESRKGAVHVDAQDGRTNEERVHRGISAEGSSRKKERVKDKIEDCSRYRDGRSSERHKRCRSSSLSRSSRDSADNGAGDSSGEGSKRKRHSRKCDLSPSPIRSRRRQVPRSPPSKHSQRRHSPYSSLEGSRRRRLRSRSKSPVRLKQ